MTDNKQFQQVHEASWDLVNSFDETSQTVANSLVAVQDGYLKFTQSIFLTWMEMLTPQWGQPTQQQQETVQKLASTPMQPYLDFLLAPLTLSRKLVEASMTAMQREREVVETRETVMHQERDLAQKASR